jgi:hypothetical protein
MVEFEKTFLIVPTHCFDLGRVHDQQYHRDTKEEIDARQVESSFCNWWTLWEIWSRHPPQPWQQSKWRLDSKQGDIERWIYWLWAPNQIFILGQGIIYVCPPVRGAWYTHNSYKISHSDSVVCIDVFAFFSRSLSRFDGSILVLVKLVL